MIRRRIVGIRDRSRCKVAAYSRVVRLPLSVVSLANRLTMMDPERSKELDSIEVKLVDGPDRAIFITRELIRALTPQQEVLVK